MSERTVQEVKTVYVAWKNSDGTEGRGFPVIHCVAETPETAFRMGKGHNVMGSPCEVKESLAVKINNQWLAPQTIYAESSEDKRKREQREARLSVRERAIALGLTEDDLRLLEGRAK